MNWPSWLLWGFAATVVFTSISELLQGVGLTRMSMPFMLGTMLTPDRSRAMLYGFFLHFGFGWLFSLVYAFIFEALGAAGWWRGIVIGEVQALFVLAVVLALMPGVHPRMASEQHGPSANNLLEPPGFLGLNYGVRTPLAVLASHAIFGAILGTFYKLK